MSHVAEIDDIEGLEDIDEGWGFLEGPFFDPVMLKEAGKIAAGGALAAVGYGLITAKVKKDDEPIFNEPWKRMALLVGLGVGGGRVLWDKQRDIARGMIGAVGGLLGVEAIKMFTTDKTSGKHLLSGGALGMLGQNSESAEDVDLLSGLGNDEDVESEVSVDALPEEAQLLGLGQASVTEQSRLFGLDQTSVSERDPSLSDVGSWIS